jgi:hypothetical protein
VSWGGISATKVLPKIILIPSLIESLKWSIAFETVNQGTVVCRVARWFIFKPKIPLWEVWQWKILVHFVATWPLFRSFGISCGFYGHWVYFLPFRYIVSRKKSGNPGVCRII